MKQLQITFLASLLILTSATGTGCLEAECGLTNFECNPGAGLVFFALASQCSYDSVELVSDTSNLSADYTNIAITWMGEFSDGMYASGAADRTTPSARVGIILKSVDGGLTWNLEYEWYSGTGGTEYSNTVVGLNQESDGDITGIATGINGTIPSWYVIGRPSGGSWQVFNQNTGLGEATPLQTHAIGERLIGVGQTSPPPPPFEFGTFVRTVENGSISTEALLQYRQSATDTFYTTIGSNGSGIFAAGIFEGAGTPHVFLDQISSGGYNRRLELPVGTTPAVYNYAPTGITGNSNRLFFTYPRYSASPGIQAVVRVVENTDPVSSFDIQLSDDVSHPYGIALRNGRLLTVFSNTNPLDVTENAPVIAIIEDAGQTVRTIFPADYTNHLMRITLYTHKPVGIYEMRDRSVWIPYPVSTVSDANRPTRFLRIACQ